MNEEEPASPCPGSWVSMATRVRNQWPHCNILYKDLGQILPIPSSSSSKGGISPLKKLSINTVLANDNLAWHLACSCPTGMFDYAMETFIKELAHRYRINSGQRLQYNLTRSIVRLSLHCIHNTLPLIHFLRQIKELFDAQWFRWSSCRYHPADDVAAMWAFYAELADAMAVGYVVPRLYEREVPSLPHLDLSGIPRLRDSTWSLKTIYDAGNKELNQILAHNASSLQLTMDLEVEGLDRKQLRLLHKLAVDRRKHLSEEGSGGKFLLGVRHVYVTSLPVDVWDTMVEDVLSFPELTHLTLNMCGVTGDAWETLRPLGGVLTGLALPNNPDLRDLQPLAHFTKLSSLDLCNVDLRGLMAPLVSLPLGLTYLGLSGCRLKEEEIGALANSKHCSTLLQLDISENSARGKPSLYTAFIQLFQALSTVEVLNVSHCHIPDHGEELQTQLEGALQSLSTLQLIAFSSKDFSSSNSGLLSVLDKMECKIFYTL